MSSRFCQSALQLQNCRQLVSQNGLLLTTPLLHPQPAFHFPFFSSLDSWHRPTQLTPFYFSVCICSCDQLRHLDQEEQAREQSCYVGTGGCSPRGLHVWVWDRKDGVEIQIIVNSNSGMGWGALDTWRLGSVPAIGLFQAYQNIKCMCVFHSARTLGQVARSIATATTGIT